MCGNFIIPSGDRPCLFYFVFAKYIIRYHAGFTVPVLIHPTAYVSPDAVLSPGCIVRAKAVVSRYARLGEACIINVGGMVDHDCVLGNGCHILMGAVVRNEVTLTEKTWLGANQVAE